MENSFSGQNYSPNHEISLWSQLPTELHEMILKNFAQTLLKTAPNCQAAKEELLNFRLTQKSVDNHFNEFCNSHYIKTLANSINNHQKPISNYILAKILLNKNKFNEFKQQNENQASQIATDLLGDISTLDVSNDQLFRNTRSNISNGANINLQDAQGNTALIRAVQTNNQELTKMLISAYADLNIQNIRGETALILAAKFNDLEITNLLLKAKAQLNAQDRHSNTALLWAVKQNNLSIINILIAAKANLNIQDSNGKTALFLAAEAANKKLVKILIDGRANLDIQENYGFTALHWACREGYDNIAKILITSGANLNLQNNHGYTPLMVAVINDKLNIFEMLIESGAKLNKQDNSGETALHIALRCLHNTKLANKIINSKANLNIQDNKGNTPLLLIVKRAVNGFEYEERNVTLNLVDNLIKHNINLNLQDINGNTALSYLAFQYNIFDRIYDSRFDLIKNISHLLINASDDLSLPLCTALNNNNYYFTKLLIKYFSDVNRQFITGDTFLILLAKHSKEPTLLNDYIKNKRVNLNLKNKNGNTALIEAVKSGKLSNVVVLLYYGADAKISNNKGKKAIDYMLKHQKVKYYKQIEKLLKMRTLEKNSEEKNLKRLNRKRTDSIQYYILKKYNVHIHQNEKLAKIRNNSE